MADEALWSAAVLPPLSRCIRTRPLDRIAEVLTLHLKSESKLPHSKWLNVKIVRNIKLVARKIKYSLEKSSIGFPFKPACRAPRIVGRNAHNSVLDWILVNVVESGEIGTMKRDVRFPILKPHLSIGRSVLFVDPNRC